MSQFLRHLKSVLFIVGLGLGLVMASPAAHAVASDKTFFWSANCVDCATAAAQDLYGVTGKLELLNYEMGDPIMAGNFRSFSYGGSNLVLPFYIGGVITERHQGLWGADTIFAVAGQIDTVPAANRFEIQFDDGLFFQTQADGSWSVCAPSASFYYGGNSCFTFPGNSDFGQAAVFTTTPVPEPGVWAMLAAGLGIVAFMRRRNAAAAV